MTEGKEIAYVMDTSGLIIGYIPSNAKQQVFTVPEVIEEVKVDYYKKTIIVNAIENGFLKVVEPKEESIKKIMNISFKTRDIDKLSNTDIKVLALSFELNFIFKVILITDDYSIQNIAKKLNLEIKSIKEKGIIKVIEWIKYCPACFRSYHNNNIKECRICGTELKVKPKKK